MQATRIADLLGKKSVRTTFRLHPKAVELKGEALADDVKAMVGEDDALYQSLVSVMDAYGKAVADMQKRVHKGRRIAEFPLDALRRDQAKR